MSCRKASFGLCRVKWARLLMQGSYSFPSIGLADHRGTGLLGTLPRSIRDEQAGISPLLASTARCDSLPCRSAQNSDILRHSPCRKALQLGDTVAAGIRYPHMCAI